MKRNNTISAVVMLIVLAAVLVFYSSQGTSQTTPPTSFSGQQNEIAEMKKQIVALEQRIYTLLEERLVDLYRYVVVII